MKKTLLAILALHCGLTAVQCSLHAQPLASTPAVTEGEKEAAYVAVDEDRVGDILKAMNLPDEAQASAVHDVLVNQYHELRMRDAAIDAQLRASSREICYANRAPYLAAQSKPLHDQFIAKLNALLVPPAVEKIKDLMTHNQAKTIYDAYCATVPGLTDAEKEKVIEWLKAAREEALDGGCAPEKAAIFQKYKDQINGYLEAQGHHLAH